MNKQRLMAYSAVLMIALCSCSHLKPKAATCEEFLRSIKSYEATATVVFLKDRQANTIAMKQQANSEGSYEMMYLLPEQLKGTTMSFDGEKLIEAYPNSEKKIEQKAGVAENEIILTSFIKRLQDAEHVKKQEAVLDGKKVMTYEIPIEGSYKYLAKEKVWIDKEQMIPLQLEIYDTEGNVSIEVQYEDFKYNS